MNNNLGLGVMIESIGKKIKKVWLDKEENQLKFEFVDNTTLKIWDGGQSCCEVRYMETDDVLQEHIGGTLLQFELKDAPNQEDEFGEMHEIQFLDVMTDKGIFQISNHNEHNGYYGGFWIQASK